MQFMKYSDDKNNKIIFYFGKSRNECDGCILFDGVTDISLFDFFDLNMVANANSTVSNFLAKNPFAEKLQMVRPSRLSVLEIISQ